MTHEQLAANNFLEQLPPEKRAKLSRLAIRRKTTIAALIKEGLLKVADDINNAGDKGPRPTTPAGYHNANAA
jgi:uncharacterized protein YaeQ